MRAYMGPRVSDNERTSVLRRVAMKLARRALNRRKRGYPRVGYAALIGVARLINGYAI